MVDCGSSGLFALNACVEFGCMHLKSLFNRLSNFLFEDACVRMHVHACVHVCVGDS